jgi:hypothetical protein
MNRAEHYRKAEQLLTDARDGANSPKLLAMAQIHALLANVPAGVSVAAKMDADDEAVEHASSS